MRQRSYITFTLVVGVILGFFSMLSDSPAYPTVNLSAFDTTVQIVAGFLNDLITWFALAIVVGYIFSRSVKQALAMGACFAVFAILAYFFFNALFGSQPLQPDQSVPIGSIEFFLAKGEWLVASAVGGAVGGLIGFASRTRPSALLALTLFIIARLVLNGTSSWRDSIGVAQNGLFIVLAVASVMYFVVKLRANKQTPRR